MAKYRQALPQLHGAFLMTDGGLETELIFHRGFELAEFAAFPLLRSDAGRTELRDYYAQYVDIARESGVGIVLESPTWRANPDWATRLGYTPDELDQMNRSAIALMNDLRAECEMELPHVVISGCIGPRGDGYVVGDAMDPDSARDYHARQIRVFADAGVDMVAAITMTYPEEAIGITRAAGAAALPVAISFTVETDGRLPNGQPLPDAIAQVDAATGNGPAYYMINCAHPTHFERLLDGAAWTDRIRGLRANASMKSHAELDEADELDEGDPTELAAAHRRLHAHLPSLAVLGGCCGTDHRHVRQITTAWLDSSRQREALVPPPAPRATANP